MASQILDACPGGLDDSGGRRRLIFAKMAALLLSPADPPLLKTPILLPDFRHPPAAHLASAIFVSTRPAA
ncbi:MAG TPA: hypothetical protein VN639_15880 [Azonexus sp.]|nr:hypothetical protein [Azonexus sp.]